MGLKETLALAHEALSNAEVPHALIGGMGLAALGIHRATYDVDFLISEENKDQAKSALLASGWALQLETAEVLHFGGKGIVDLLLAKRPLSKRMLAEAKRGNGIDINVVAPEAIIGLKIQAYKNDKEREFQDKADISAILKKCSDLDWARIKEYADLFGEWEFIQSLRKK